MSKETLIIPTPYGKRRVFCQCVTGKTFHNKGTKELSTPVMCVGCGYIKRENQESCNGTASNCRDSDRTRVFTPDTCDTCKGLFYVFVNKADEPKQ